MAAKKQAKKVVKKQAKASKVAKAKKPSKLEVLREKAKALKAEMKEAHKQATDMTLVASKAYNKYEKAKYAHMHAEDRISAEKSKLAEKKAQKKQAPAPQVSAP